MAVQIGGGSDDMLAFPGTIQVWDNHGVEDDQYNASGFLSDQASVLVEFEDAAQTALASDGLPTSLNVGAFSVRKFLVSIPSGGNLGRAVAVPEPAGAMAAALALCAVAAGRRGALRCGGHSRRS